MKLVRLALACTRIGRVTQSRASENGNAIPERAMDQLAFFWSERSPRAASTNNMTYKETVPRAGTVCVTTSSGKTDQNCIPDKEFAASVAVMDSGEGTLFVDRE